MEGGNSTYLGVIRVGDNLWLVFEDLFCEQSESTLGTDFNEQSSPTIIHCLHLSDPLNSRGHLRGEFGQNGLLGAAAGRSDIGIPTSIEIRCEGDLRQPNIQPLEEMAQRFIRRRNDSGMECVTGLQLNTRRSPFIKDLHRPLHRLGLTGDDGHLRAVLVGGDYVTFLCFQYGLNLFIRGRYGSHDSTIWNLYAAHFSASGSHCTKGGLEIKNVSNHQGSIFTQRVPSNHVRFEPMRLHETIQAEVGSEHSGLGVFRLFEFEFSFRLLIS